jgi:hypothetical protein
MPPSGVVIDCGTAKSRLRGDVGVVHWHRADHLQIGGVSGVEGEHLAGSGAADVAAALVQLVLSWLRQQRIISSPTALRTAAKAFSVYPVRLSAYGSRLPRRKRVRCVRHYRPGGLDYCPATQRGWTRCRIGAWFGDRSADDLIAVANRHSGWRRRRDRRAVGARSDTARKSSHRVDGRRSLRWRRGRDHVVELGDASALITLGPKLASSLGTLHVRSCGR